MSADTRYRHFSGLKQKMNVSMLDTPEDASSSWRKTSGTSPFVKLLTLEIPAPRCNILLNFLFITILKMSSSIQRMDKKYYSSNCTVGTKSWLTVATDSSGKVRRRDYQARHSSLYKSFFRCRTTNRDASKHVVNQMIRPVPTPET